MSLQIDHPNGIRKVLNKKVALLLAGLLDAADSFCSPFRPTAPKANLGRQGPRIHGNIFYSWSVAGK